MHNFGFEFRSLQSRMLAFSLIMLVTLCVPAGVQAQTGTGSSDDARLAQFQESLDSLRRQFGIPGLSAAIVSNGRIIWEAGFGFQDVENQIPATPDTPYRTASITKTFASMLLMRCVERGTLFLDTPIRSYTSGISDSRVTVRHLFTHTSQSSPPGESYLYSGDRYNFLTPVVESCTGKSFREALAKDILDRLDLRDSVPGQDMEFPSPQVAALFTPEILQRYSRVIQRLAKPYTVDNFGRPVLSAYPPKGIFASAGLISTVRDLARYDAAIDQNILLSPQTQQQAWTNHVNSKGQKLPYGLGWFVQTYGGERLIWHYGQWDTFSGLFLKVPGRHVTLILLANSSGLSAPFNSLGAGNVAGSPFANLFLQMLSDSEAFRGNPLEESAFFVRQHYLDFLGREPDADGQAFWQNQIDQCGTDAQCLEVARINVSASFFYSIEFQESGYLVYRAYKAAFGNLNDGAAPVPLTRAEFLPDTRAISNGVIVNQGNWQQQVAANKQAFFEDFVSRPRFVTAFPADLPADQFVDRLYSNAGIAPVSAPNRAAALLEITPAPADNAARARALRLVAEDPVLVKQEFNRAFVLMEYFGYLQRDPPDAPEPTLDYQGYNFWLNKLNQFNGNYVEAEMVKAFLNSNEYQARFRN